MIYVSSCFSQEEWAARKVQGLFRKKHAWKKLKFMLNSVYEKEYDPDTDSWFYVNKVRRTLGLAPTFAVGYRTA